MSFSNSPSSNSHNQVNKIHAKPVTGVGIYLAFMGLLAIAFSITLRVIPNAIHPDLLADLFASPQALNEIYATYQYPLIITLILSGLIVDIIGPRIILVTALILAIAANYFFSTASSTSMLAFSRIVIAFTHPFILTSVLALGTHWLPRRHFSLFAGLLFGTLLIMPVLDYQPLQNISSLQNLQYFIWLANIAGVFIVCSIVVTEQFTDRVKHRHTFAGLLRPLSYYKVWLICLVSMMGWIANTFLLHYGAFYLIWHFNFNMQRAIEIVHTSFIYFSLGAVFMGIMADVMPKKRYLLAGGYIIAALLICILMWVPGLPFGLIPLLFFLTAFFISSTIISYTKASDYCTLNNSGITLGLVLSITTIGSSFFVNLSGSVLQKYIYVYSSNPSNQELLLALLPVVLLLFLGAIIALTLLRPIHLHDISESSDVK